jgi:hypothetical protein
MRKLFKGLLKCFGWIMVLFGFAALTHGVEGIKFFLLSGGLGGIIMIFASTPSENSDHSAPAE